MANKEVIVIEESLIGSVIKDVFTFGMFAGLLYFNHEYLGGSTIIDLAFVICVIIFLLGRNSKAVHRFTSKKEAIKHLELQDDWCRQ